MSIIHHSGGTVFDQANWLAYYKLENTTDSGPSGITLTNIATCTFPAALYGNGVLTDGSTQYLRVDNNMGIDGGACTFVVWTKPTTDPGNGEQRMITKQLNVTSKVGFAITYNNALAQSGLGLAFVRVRNDISSTSAGYSYTMPKNSFTLVIGTYDGTNLRVYVNGNASAPVAASGNGSGTDYLSNMFSINANYYVQTGTPGVNLLYPGLTDECLVFGRAWSAQEVQNYFNAYRNPIGFGTNY